MIKWSISKLGGESISIYDQGCSTNCLRSPKVKGITALASLSQFQIVQSCAGIEWFSIDWHRLHYCSSGGEEANIFGWTQKSKGVFALKRRTLYLNRAKYVLIKACSFGVKASFRVFCNMHFPTKEPLPLPQRTHNKEFSPEPPLSHLQLSCAAASIHI